MESNNTKQILRLYFGKHFSRYGRVLFGRWLRGAEDAEEKEKMLEKLWNQSTEISTESTRMDWMALQQRLSGEPKQWTFSVVFRKGLQYAAIGTLLLLTAGATYWITARMEPARHVEMAELFVPYGESRQIILSDSSSVWLAAGSVLVYPKDFIDTDTRTVYLTGEASFTVQRNPQKPFIVKTNYLDVQALGTVFTVESYPTDSCTKATLEEGSVRVDVKYENIQPSILKPDQQLVYSHTEHTVLVKSVDASLYKMERNGYLIFENVRFADLMSTLERQFNVKIHYNSQKYADEWYNVKFAPEESLEDVLKILQQLAGIHYSIKENVVFIN